MDGSTKPSQPENYKREIAFILFKRKTLILTTTLLVFTLAVLIAFLWPPTYGAHGSLLLKGRKLDRDPTVLESTELRSTPVTENDLYSELEILTSAELIRRTIAQLDEATRMLIHEEPDKRVSAFREAMDARVVPTSHVIQVTMTGQDEAATLSMLQTLFETYEDFRRGIYSPGGITELLGAKVRMVRRHLEDKTHQLTAFLEKSGLANADQQIDANLMLRRELESALLATEGRIAELQGDIDYLGALLQSRDVQVFASVHLPDGTVLDGRADIAGHVRQQQARLEVARDTRADIKTRISALDETNLKLHRDQLEYQSMEQEAQVLRQSYQTLLTRHAEATIGDTGDREANPYVAVVAPPRLMDDALFPKAGVVLPVGLVAAMMLGISLAFIKESLDHTFTRPEDVRQALGVPVALSIPNKAVRNPKLWNAAAWAHRSWLPRLWMARPPAASKLAAATAALAVVTAVLWLATDLVTNASVTLQPKPGAADSLAEIPAPDSADGAPTP